MPQLVKYSHCSGKFGIGVTKCTIKVVAATCGGASANCKFFHMQVGLAHDDELRKSLYLLHFQISIFT